MSTSTAPAAPRPSQQSRTARVTDTMAGKLLVITETKGKKTTSCHYFLERFDAGMGRVAYRLRKAVGGSGTDPEGDQYTACLSREGHSCECKGHLRHGRCKHVESIRALTAAGLLS